ncbi:hypothetical protein K461DRAFT_277959 [Myriangium duriaei CBS 260.36]|uniref:Zn(2)-C6 fungal-type domain-containing protein n=1 Tax=Myriangium duriaei CBS 260.36 TaxID=1168546 RepID=A0A9P4MKH5_9PEZI|nr:hypothetical protein K461DRAFT_277959 [Myriangium duriaei CBS 260.36]
MSDGQNYPSPNEAHVGNNGPFYGRPNAIEQSPPPQEIPDDLQLRADLARSLAPLTNAAQQGQIDEDLLQSSGAYGQHLLAPGPVSIHEGSPSDQPQHDGSTKRKDQRHKVSKACDECRRKKIRCDAPNEEGHDACSNCKRTFTGCTFSRQQLKRGPSKGYIKELADRLKDLEEHARLQQMHPDMPFTTPPNMPEDAIAQRFAEFQAQLSEASQPPQPAQVPQMAGQKRPYDTVDLGQRESPDQLRRSAPFAQDQFTPYQQSPAPQDPPEVAQSFGRQFQPFFKYGAEPPRRDISSTAFDANAPDVPAISDWDDEVVDEYYQLIHQTFPLLPQSKNNLRIRISACPAGLREAFVTVLACMMKTFPSSKLQTGQTYPASLKRAAELIAGYPFDNPSTHTPGTDLVYLQTLLLMAMMGDNFGPLTMQGQAGPSRAEWLGRAAGVAAQLEINLIRPRERLVSDGDPDSEERLARRVWWVLFILDRWHSCSTADLLKLPENSVVLMPEDQMLLGESTYHLARLSFIIGHLASILTTTKTPETNVMAPSNPASYLLGMTLAGEIDRFRESVESVWGTLNLVHLSYHHSHLLIKRLNPTTEPTELVSHALKVATVLNSRQTPLTPLNHHFGALSAMTLCELVDIPRTRDDAIKGLNQLAEALGAHRGLAGHPTISTGWDQAIRAMITTKREKLHTQLQQEAGLFPNGDTNGIGEEPLPRSEGNVAATAPVERGGPKKFDPSLLTMYGYLTALGQEKFQT